MSKVCAVSLHFSLLCSSTLYKVEAKSNTSATVIWSTGKWREREFLGGRRGKLEEVLAIILFSNSRRFGVANCGDRHRLSSRALRVNFFNRISTTLLFIDSVTVSDVENSFHLSITFFTEFVVVCLKTTHKNYTT